MSDLQRKIAVFNLCKALVDLLGKEQATTDLQILYERHPEMFKDIEELRQIIEEVVSETEIIVKANRNNANYPIIKAAKRLSDKKMGNIIIKNQDGTNEIFHANKKKISEFTRLAKKVGDKNLIGGENAQLSHPDENEEEANTKKLKEELAKEKAEKEELKIENQKLKQRLAKFKSIDLYPFNNLKNQKIKQ